MIDHVEVSATFMECLFQQDEIVNGVPISEPVMARAVNGFYGFHRDRLEENRTLVGEWLLQLNDDFFESGGGGMSFLNFCVDKNGEQWTGLHRTCDQLIAMGVGLGYISLSPLEMNEMLPGNVPYVTVHDGKIPH